MLTWPDGKTVVLGLMIPWETWPADLGSSQGHQRTAQRPVPKGAVYDRDMWAVYDHMYAERHGLRRLLDTLDDCEVKATFVANGARVESHPDLARYAQSRGHDMASENYHHEYAIMYTEAEERESLAATVKAFETVLGQAPTGYISPGHRSTPNTVRILMELGFGWDSDFMYADKPFIITDGDRDIVGMSYAHLSDYHTYSNQGRTPRAVFDMLGDQLTALRREGARGQISLTGFAIHPYICQPFRIEQLRDLLLEIKESMPDVWVATRSEVAAFVRENRPEFESVTLESIEAEFPPNPLPGR